MQRYCCTVYPLASPTTNGQISVRFSFSLADFISSGVNRVVVTWCCILEKVKFLLDVCQPCLVQHNKSTYSRLEFFSVCLIQIASSSSSSAHIPSSSLHPSPQHVLCPKRVPPLQSIHIAYASTRDIAQYIAIRSHVFSPKETWGRRLNIVLWSYPLRESFIFNRICTCKASNRVFCECLYVLDDGWPSRRLLKPF